MDNKLPWWAIAVDLESTGLSARDDVPLEVGVALIDCLGNKGPSVDFLVYEDNDLYKRAVQRGKADKFVGPMHEKSRLWRDLERAYESKIDAFVREEADEYLCDWLTRQNVRFGTLPLFGNSIGSLDRPFILEHFPEFNLATSYRNIDVSSFKEACKALNSTVWKKLEPIVGNKENATHRVMGDIDACLVEWRAYVDNFLFVDGI